jgi:hypothetical protein
MTFCSSQINSKAYTFSIPRIRSDIRKISTLSFAQPFHLYIFLKKAKNALPSFGNRSIPDISQLISSQ